MHVQWALPIQWHIFIWMNKSSDLATFSSGALVYFMLKTHESIYFPLPFSADFLTVYITSVWQVCCRNRVVWACNWTNVIDCNDWRRIKVCFAIWKRKTGASVLSIRGAGGNILTAYCWSFNQLLIVMQSIKATTGCPESTILTHAQTIMNLILGHS